MNNLLFPQAAPQLVAHGYRPVPITPGTKAPTRVAQWQNYEYDPADDTRFADCGTGILTGDVLGIDIDVPDAAVVRDLLSWLLRTYGLAPVRFGNKPKALALYRATEPAQRKIQTAVYKRGELKGRVEVLARGQQFVAHAIHPDTRQPYKWYAGDPLAVPADNLPALTTTQVSEIVQHCAERLAQWGTGPAPGLLAAPAQLDAALFPPRETVAAENEVLIKQRQPATRAELLRALADYAEYDQSEYSSWLEVGAIIHHQTGGRDVGLKLFIAYSRCLSGFYDDRPDAAEEECIRKWASFGRSGAKPVTFGTLIHRVTEQREKRAGVEELTRGNAALVRELAKPDGSSQR